MHWTQSYPRVRMLSDESTMTATASCNFELARFAEDCTRALREGSPNKALREVVEQAVSEPSALVAALGEPRRAEVQKLYHAPQLTILNVVWAPKMTVMPHDHRMAAVIGIYTGREDNIFWRRLPGGKVEAAGARALEAREAAVLGADIIHSVTNPIARFTGALHVYAGDFFGAERSEWDPESLLERRYDVERALRLFTDENAR
jgi:predicted metal-dependent enzyme (double-stranded beta helix superfamily)